MPPVRIVSTDGVRYFVGKTENPKEEKKKRKKRALTRNPPDFLGRKRGAGRAENMSAETVTDQMDAGRLDQSESDDFFQKPRDGVADARRHVRRDRVHDVVGHPTPVHRDDVIGSGRDIP